MGICRQWYDYNMTSRAPDIFVSSTCYDLIDLRASLHLHLRHQGFQVRLSDAPDSAFEVDGGADSIASCLANVEAADAVVCIINQRYGRPLDHGPYKGISATHAEIRHARQNKSPRHLFFFARNRSLDEFDGLISNPSMSTRWVESEDAQQRARWVDFLNEIKAIPQHDAWSNWCDPFKDVTDLAPLVIKRLLTEFPEYTGTLAMRPDRMCRMTFIHGGGQNNIVGGRFRNVGVGAAFSEIPRSISRC